MGPNFWLGRHTPTHFQRKNPPGLYLAYGYLSILGSKLLHVRGPCAVCLDLRSQERVSVEVIGGCLADMIPMYINIIIDTATRVHNFLLSQNIYQIGSGNANNNIAPNGLKFTGPLTPGRLLIIFTITSWPSITGVFLELW